MLVGAVIVLGVAAAVLGSLWLSGRGFGSPRVPLDVLVTDAGQLRDGNAVKFRGVQIGRVALIEVEPGGAGVRLHLLLDEQNPLPPDAGALVAAESLFGEWQVELVSKSDYPSFEFFTITPAIQTASENPILGGFTYPDISRLTAAANAISENLQVLTSRVDRAFTDETAQALSSAIRDIQIISQTLRSLVEEQASTIDTLTADVRAAASEIAGAARAGRSTLEQADSLFAGGELASILASLEEVSSNLASFTGELDGASEEFSGLIESADRTFARVDRLTERVESGEGLLGQLFADSTLTDRTTGVLTELELLLRDLRENPGRYVRLSIF